MLLDVNVPMYAAGQAHSYKDACMWIMQEVADGRLAAAIDTETIQEILHRYGALQRWDIAVAMAEYLRTIVTTIYPLLEADVRLAITLFGDYAPRGVSVRDIVHAAIMRNNNISTVISTDTHFDRIAGIRRIDPQDLYMQR